MNLDDSEDQAATNLVTSVMGTTFSSGATGGGNEWEHRQWHFRPAEGTEPSVLHNEWAKAGLGAVPEGAICLSSSQILAYGKAAVRLERSAAERHERSVFKR